MPNPVTGPYGPQKQDGKVPVNGTDNSFGWIFGANWRPTDSLSFGYSHRSEIKHDIRGTATFDRSEEHTSELQSLMRISYAVFCLKKKKNKQYETTSQTL